MDRRDIVRRAAVNIINESLIICVGAGWSNRGVERRLTSTAVLLPSAKNKPVEMGIGDVLIGIGTTLANSLRRLAESGERLLAASWLVDLRPYHHHIKMRSAAMKR